MERQFAFVEATDADADAVRDLVNRHELSVDPQAATMSDDGIAELMAGYVDESQSWLMQDAAGALVGFVQLHPDANRSIFFPDVYCDPLNPDLSQATAAAVDFVLSLSEEQHPDWSLRPGLNSKDDLLRGAYLARGFEYLRKFWSLSRPITADDVWPELPAGIDVRRAEDHREDMQILHALHQDSFSNHFGFKPREFENWMSLELEKQTRDPAGNFILFENQQPAAFLLSATEMAHEHGGYVDLIGVKHASQGKGFGKLLLQCAAAHARDKGFTKIDLTVDTGNESAALRVYEAAGFRPFSAWEQFELVRAIR